MTSATTCRMGQERYTCNGTIMIEHDNFKTTISFAEVDGDAETMFAAACRRLETLYAGTTAKYSLAPQGAIFLWSLKHGLVLHASIRWVDDCIGRVIDVFAMTACQPHGYQQGALLFAAEIGTHLNNMYRVGGGGVTCSADRAMCNKYRRLAKEPKA